MFDQISYDGSRVLVARDDFFVIITPTDAREGKNSASNEPELSVFYTYPEGFFDRKYNAGQIVDVPPNGDVPALASAPRMTLDIFHQDLRKWQVKKHRPYVDLSPTGVATSLERQKRFTPIQLGPTAHESVPAPEFD